ncbi:MAG: isochorismatase family protein [Ilumatobacteraceae bacterium]
MAESLHPGDLDSPPGTEYRPSDALVVVDVQHDFADPAGSLYVAGGETIVAAIAAEMTAIRVAGGTLVVTQDWHPPVTPHFATDGGTWPVHCVRDTWGPSCTGTCRATPTSSCARAPPVPTGTGVLRRRPGERSRRTDRAGRVPARAGVTRVIVCGLASDVCVAASAKDAFAAGFATVVRWDLSRPVFPDTAAEVRRDLEALGVEVLAGRAS